MRREEVRALAEDGEQNERPENEVVGEGPAPDRSPPVGKKYVLKLYVTGKGSESVRVFQAIKRFCDQHIAGQYQLWVIDVLIQPEQAADIDATPTLVKTKPHPPRKIVSDFANPDLVFAALGIPDGEDESTG